MATQIPQAASLSACASTHLEALNFIISCAALMICGFRISNLELSLGVDENVMKSRKWTNARCICGRARIAPTVALNSLRLRNSERHGSKLKLGALQFYIT
jgi:hypothetical protein